MSRAPTPPFLFAILPDVAPLAQWRLLEAGFQRMRSPAAMLPACGAIAAFGVSGQIWCLIWAAAIVATLPATGRIAAEFDRRGSDGTTLQWARIHAAAAGIQAGLLGAGGFIASLSGDPALALLTALPLGFVAATGAAGVALPGIARLLPILLLGPLAIGGLAVAHPVFLALALVAGVQLGLAIMLGTEAAERAVGAAVAQALPQPTPLPGHTSLPPAAADFQKLLGRCQATGLPNRHSFGHLLAQECARAYRAETALSLLLIQWDGFDPAAPDAQMNAGLGAVARRLRTELRRPADIIASLGGGRFGVLLPFTDALGAATVARNLQTALAVPEIENGAGTDTGGAAALSVGAATYCGKGLLPDTQLQAFAEEALDAARKTGGNRINRYDPTATTLRPPPFTPVGQPLVVTEPTDAA